MECASTITAAAAALVEVLLEQSLPLHRGGHLVLGALGAHHLDSPLRGVEGLHELPLGLALLAAGFRSWLGEEAPTLEQKCLKSAAVVQRQSPLRVRFSFWPHLPQRILAWRYFSLKSVP